MSQTGFGFSFGAPTDFSPNFGGDIADNINASVSTGLQIYNTIQQGKLLSEQIQHNQTPSIVGVPGAPSGALAAALPNAVGLIGSSSTGTLILLVGVVLLVIMLFRR